MERKEMEEMMMDLLKVAYNRGCNDALKDIPGYREEDGARYATDYEILSFSEEEIPAFTELRKMAIERVDSLLVASDILKREIIDEEKVELLFTSPSIIEFFRNVPLKLLGEKGSCEIDTDGDGGIRITLNMCEGYMEFYTENTGDDGRYIENSIRMFVEVR